MTYKTPDVYVEEISTFPRSVAEVATAVPAFVGYTEKTTRLVTDDLKNVPILIKSLPDFEAIFGKGPPLVINRINLDLNNSFTDCKITSAYYLYDSVRLHFDNGGGRCYIVSVGTYHDTVDTADLTGGLDVVATKDEPTMLVVPDAVVLDDDHFAQVQQHALIQCGKLKDRVAILDVRQGDELGGTFRNKIGINSLRYGAAYTPWLLVSYEKDVRYADVEGVIYKNGGGPVKLETLTGDANTIAAITERENVGTDLATIAADVLAFVGAGKSVTGNFGDLVNAYALAKTKPNPVATAAGALQNMAAYLLGLARVIDKWVTPATQLANATVYNHAALWTSNVLAPAYLEALKLEVELNGKLNAYTAQLRTGTHPKSDAWKDTVTTPPTNKKVFDYSDAELAGSTYLPALPAAATDAAKLAVLDDAEAIFAKLFSTASGAIDLIASGADEERDKLEKTLMQGFGVYANIINGVKFALAEVPPSGAMAGVYCRVDNDRGVWKAPANVSLVSVIAPTVSFTRDETDDLNVDPVGGKSINAIREFIGQGTLVWGARTLAGNDNEWRYISVRRFFNMVEESVKKSTYFYVFENNVADTWVKVRGMIENYLTQKWREGALAGAVPKDAFYVRCGLGTTMTSDDILNGYLNVEIGMAVVRPAEFIVLKFSHKLQVS